ncbi:MAG: hypothetical protein ACYC3I_17170 [Gemmataceae bacterium]
MGIEANDVSTLSANDLRQSPQAGGAKSGAVNADALFAQIAKLSEEDRARLAALLTGKSE